MNNFRVRVLVRVCVVALLLGGVSAFGGTIYVEEGVSGAGSSWADAYGDLQDALDNADSGDEIWVAEGTYYPTYDHGLGIGGHGRHFRMINGVAIYGGFSSTGDPGWEDRDPNTYETILSGDIGVPGEADDNCYHVFYHPDGISLDATAMLDGFTITAGNADDGGGGMRNWSSSPTVSNCTFSDNSAGYGGGMCNMENSSPTVTGCTFSGNSAVVGGGGGMLNWKSSPTVTHCTFSGNSAYYGGGGMCNGLSSPTVSNCVFSGNLANGTDGDGGGMYTLGGSPTVTGCTFSGNSANGTDGGDGGGIYNMDSSLTVTSCTFAGNTAENGNGLACDSPDQSYPSAIEIINCILWDGSSEIWNNDGSTITIVYSDVQGGWPGLGNIDVDPLFVDAGYWDLNDTPSDVSDDLWVDGDYHLQSEGWRWDSAGGEWAWDDVTSRCIDAGCPGASLGDEVMTLVVDPLNHRGENIRVNMGAYGGTAKASMPPYDWALLADLTNDGAVNFEDLAGQAVDWQETAEQQPGDLDRSGSVDIADLVLMARDWLEQTIWY